MSLEHSLTKNITPYKPAADPNPLNVVFLPIMVNGTSKYITAATDDTDNEIHVENMAEYSEETIMVNSDKEEDKKPVSIFNIGENPAASFYIGSVTAVGLYILFCLLRKSK
jgi:hypothetical protein